MVWFFWLTSDRQKANGIERATCISQPSIGRSEGKERGTNQTIHRYKGTDRKD